QIGSMLNMGEILKIADHLRCARRVKSFKNKIKDDKDNYPLLDDLISGITTNKPLEDEIYRCIISEDEISDRATVSLYNIRKQIREKNNAIRDKLNSIIRSSENSKALQEHIITVRGDRFVVPVKSEYKGSFAGLVHDQSASGSTLFIEPMAVVDMNNDINELKSKEKAEIERILSDFTLKISQNIDSINVNNDILSELDFIFAKAKLSFEFNCIPPTINDKGFLNIKNARHPLIPKETVVPNNISLGKGFNVLVITGPNTGGKTVTLKTAGLITLMAMSGLQIPADDGSSVSVYDQVFADIGDEQSIEQSLSTFSSHMTNIVGIINEATGRSLCLFDELGAGTDPTEGASLAMSILDELHGRGCKVIATTHYSELKVFALQREGIENASVEFDVETLMPTYRLSIGVPGKSNAFEISRRLGLREDIIEKARKFVPKESLNFEDLISNLQHNRIVSEHEREEAERLRAQTEKIHEEYVMRKQKLDKARENVINEAKQEARKLIKQAKEEADEIIQEIRQASKMDNELERDRQFNDAKRRINEKLSGLETSAVNQLTDNSMLKPVKSVKIGDTVYIANLNKTAAVLTLPDSKGDLTVQAGIMKIDVNISNLFSKNKGSEVKEDHMIKVITSTKNRTVSPSIDLRGQTLDEAIINVDKYLDDAYLSHLDEVVIIHGKGTGVLRRGIMDMLKGHAHVKSYRPGKYGEGGTGVTVVEINR
ncbi:MAG TPA: endonuclease MutS2, partial [Clostridiaceae bacterium]|nr:endonuclease MutS2 [Clostridiaceae bacterium]